MEQDTGDSLLLCVGNPGGWASYIMVSLTCSGLLV